MQLDRLPAFRRSRMVERRARQNARVIGFVLVRRRDRAEAKTMRLPFPRVRKDRYPGWLLREPRR